MVVNFLSSDPTLKKFIDKREYVRGLEMEVEFVLLQFINAYEGDMQKFAKDYDSTVKDITLETVVRACLQHFIDYPDVIYMA